MDHADSSSDGRDSAQGETAVYGARFQPAPARHGHTPSTSSAASPPDEPAAGAHAHDPATLAARDDLAWHETQRLHLTEKVERAHQALQASLARLKTSIEASDAGLYPAAALAADLEAHGERTHSWTAAMRELAQFYRKQN